MGVAFLLDRSGLIVDRQTVGDQDAAEVFSQNVVEEVTAAALSNDIEGEQLGRKNPQPPARAGDPPAGQNRYEAPVLGAVLLRGRRIGVLLCSPADPSPERGRQG